MRLKTLTVAIFMAACTSTVYAAPDDGVEIRGPGGVARPIVQEPSARTGYGNRVVTPARQRGANANGNNSRLQAGTGAVGATNASGNKTGASNNAPATSSIANGTKGDNDSKIVIVECIKPKLPAEVKVDEPRIPRFSLTEVEDRVVTVSAGQTLLQVVNSARPNNADELDDWQILAALVRENKDKISSHGFTPGSSLKIPSAERMGLENDNTGHTIDKVASAGGLKSFNIPELELPWQQEDDRINDQKKRRAEALAEKGRLEAEYASCLSRKTEADAQAKIVANKSVADDSKAGGSQESGRISAASQEEIIGSVSAAVDDKLKKNQEITKAQLEQIQAELDKSRAENELLREAIAQSNASSQETKALVGDLVKELKNRNAEAASQKASNDDSEVDGEAISENEKLLFILLGGLALLLPIVGFYAMMRRKRNKLRRALSVDDDDELGVSDALPGEEMEPVFGAVVPETPEPAPSKKKVNLDLDSLNIDEPNSASTKDSGKGASDLGIDGAASRNEDGFPDLEHPDESIPENAVRLDIEETESPDLVPSRHNDDGLDLELDEEGFQESIRGEAAQNTESSAKDEPTKDAQKSDADVMDEWAAALAESEAPKEDASKSNPSAEKAEDAPKSDADVMDEWAAALAESEAPKEDAPKSGADKEKAEADAASPKAEDAPKSDADVMDEWAAALAESEAPKDEKPKSDADVMDEWAAALAESKDSK